MRLFCKRPYENSSFSPDDCIEFDRQHSPGENSKGGNYEPYQSGFREGGNIPEGFTCEGKDISPTLKIDGIPKEAKSLVVIGDDPDAPGGNFTIG